MIDRDYYETLGLTPDADVTTINRTYWHLARGYQAAAPADPRAHHQLDDLNEAYGILGTPHLREAYDAARGVNGAMVNGKRAPRAATTRPSSERQSGMGRMLPWRRATTRRDPSVDDRAPQPPAAASTAFGRERVDALRLSTASIVGRWRKTAAPDVLRTSQQPDTTLVDIFQSERDIDEEHEPLAAALDVLRGSRQPVELS